MAAIRRRRQNLTEKTGKAKRDRQDLEIEAEIAKLTRNNVDFAEVAES